MQFINRVLVGLATLLVSEILKRNFVGDMAKITGKKNVNKVVKALSMVAFVMVGVIGSGYVMRKYADKSTILKEASKGFDGGIL